MKKNSKKLLTCSLPKPPKKLGGNILPWTRVPPFNSKTNSAWGKVLTDIMQHEAPGDNNPYDGLITKGHECTHGINSHIRNQFAGVMGKKVNAFYMLNDRAVVMEEPPMSKAKVAQYIPKPLQGTRFGLYVVGQTAWNDQPLYLWDEWVAYVNGAAVGVELVKAGKWKTGWQDGVMGPLEFNVYAIGVAMAVKDHAPKYLDEVSGFKLFMMFTLERSMELFREGSVMEEFKWDKQDKYLRDLQTGSEAEKMRAFSREFFEPDYCQSVLGF